MHSHVALDGRRSAVERPGQSLQDRVRLDPCVDNGEPLPAAFVDPVGDVIDARNGLIDSDVYGDAVASLPVDPLQRLPNQFLLRPAGDQVHRLRVHRPQRLRRQPRLLL